LIVREELEEVVERILSYRARLLATVARQVPNLDDLTRAASLASLETTNSSNEYPALPRKSPRAEV
jgi:hypothetical protein